MSKDLQELVTQEEKNKKLLKKLFQGLFRELRKELLTAAEKGNLEVTRKALELGADVNAKYPSGQTSLHYAAYYGHENIVKLLIEEGGAKVDAKDNDGETALFFAIQQKHESVVRLLIDAGADIEIERNNGWTCWTPLLLAACFDANNIVKLLIERGAKVDARDKDGNIALHHAVENNNLEIVEFLLENGADVNAKNKDGKTAIDLVKDLNATLLTATEKGYIKLTALLIDKGADVSVNSDYWTPLHHAVENNNLEIARLLLANGASMTAENLYGETALGLANYKGHQGMITLLEAAQRAGKPQKRKMDVKEEDTVAFKQARMAKATEKVVEEAAKPSERKIEVEDVDAKRTRVEKEAEKEVEKATEKVAEKAVKPSKRKMDVGVEVEDTVASKQARLKEAQVTEIFGGLSLK